MTRHCGQATNKTEKNDCLSPKKPELMTLRKALQKV